MSADGSCEFVWAGDERTFRLGIAELLALQEKRDCGPMQLLSRLRSGEWRIEDVTETIRLGLIGAGVDSKQARELVEANCAPPQLAKHVLPARAILMNALLGDPNDPVGKAQATTIAPEATASPPSPSTAAAL